MKLYNIILARFELFQELDNICQFFRYGVGCHTNMVS